MSRYFILWSNDWCKKLEKIADFGPIEVIYRGEYQSVPALGKVAIGDTVYPVRVNGGSLYLLGRFEIAEIVEANLFLANII